MMRASPIAEAVNKLLEKGTLANERWQIISLLRDIAAELAATGESVETEAHLIREIAMTVATLRSREGLETNIDEVEEQLKKAIEAERLLRAPAGVRTRFRTRRRSTGGTYSGGGILT